MTKSLTISTGTDEPCLGRRTLLKGAAAAVAATGVTMNATLAASVAPLGQTGTPTISTAP
jgi:gluconolactonase